jgi:signal transduction histidine kinase
VDPVNEPVAFGENPRRVRDLLPTLVHQLPVGVGVVRRDRSLAFANDALARMLHLSAKRGNLQHRMDVLATDEGDAYRDDLEPVDRALSEGVATARQAVSIGLPDGGHEHAFITTVPVSDEAGRRVSVIVYLERRIDANDDPSMREAYIDTLSHELRTPITAIYGGTQLLRNEALAPDVRATVLADIAEEAEHLHLLVEDLLALARIERGALTIAIEPVLVQRVAARALRDAARRWPDRLVVVKRAMDVPAAAADDGLVAQILRNLIANAITTSPAGSQVDIVIDATPTDVRVTIGDRGAGFPSGLGDDAFRLYHHNPAVASHRPDTGLALFVARALVEAQGGRIWQTGRDGGGAEVGLSLPIYADPNVD